jgi:peptidoglycan hydrolase CwlO-like protein
MKPRALLALILALVLLPGCTKKLEEENLALKTNLAATRATKDVLEKQVGESKLELTGLRKERDELTSQKSAALAQVANLSTENQALRGRVAELEETIKKSLPPPSFELFGEVFIATKGGVAFKLSSVEVSLIARREVDAWMLERMQTSLRLRDELIPKVKAAEEEAAQAFAAWQSAREKSEAAFKAWTNSSFNEKMKELYREADLEAGRLRRVHSDKSSEVAQLKYARESLLQGAFFFDSPPPHVARVTTNSEGRFKLTLARDGDWVVIARAERATGARTERYYWVVPVAAPSGGSAELFLTNGNLTSVKGGSLLETMD